LDAAGRQLDILAAQRAFDILDGEIVGGEPLPVDPDAHGIATLAEDGDIGDAVEVLEPVDHVAIDVVGQFERIHPLGDEGDVDDRLGVRLDLGDGGLVDLVRQAPAHAADAVAHVAGGDVDIDIRAEAHGDAARFGPARRLENVDAGDAGD